MFRRVHTSKLLVIMIMWQVRHFLSEDNRCLFQELSPLGIFILWWKKHVSFSWNAWKIKTIDRGKWTLRLRGLNNCRAKERRVTWWGKRKKDSLSWRKKTDSLRYFPTMIILKAPMWVLKFLRVKSLSWFGKGFIRDHKAVFWIMNKLLKSKFQSWKNGRR